MASGGRRSGVPLWAVAMIAAGSFLPAADAWGWTPRLRGVATAGGVGVAALCVGMARDRRTSGAFRGVLCAGVVALWWFIYLGVQAVPSPPLSVFAARLTCRPQPPNPARQPTGAAWHFLRCVARPAARATELGRSAAWRTG